MKDYFQLKKMRAFNPEIKDTKDLNKIDIKDLYDLYKKEFINSCELILIENQNDFLDNFYDKMNLIIKYEFGENIFEKNTSLYLSKKKCENNFVTDIYWPMRNSCANSIKKYSAKSNKFKDYLVNFRPHCIYDQIPLHTCGSKFIQIMDENEKLKKNVLYVVCTGCNKCYYSNCIKMNCHYCQINFYSEIIIFPNNLFPATWKEYHCNNENMLINEQMHCINCNHFLYIKNNNKLYCKNCKDVFDPMSIIWTCKECEKEFKSEIKIYNPLEFKEIELAKRDAYLYKKIAKPNYLPCNCLSKYDIDNYNFVHEQHGKCKGLLFYSFINNNEFLVCSKCNKIYKLSKFYWNCPKCYKQFISNELRFSNYYAKNNFGYNNANKNNLLYSHIERKINNSNSQKLMNIDNINNNYKVYNKNNSYIKKRINSSYTSNNNSMNNSIEKYEESSENSLYRKKNKKRKTLSIILNNDNKGINFNLNNNISNNNSNKENNSITNKYNIGIGSTAHSSHLNNNNIKHPQTARKITDSFLSKKEKTNNQSKSSINRYIDEKVLNIPLSAINKKNYENQNKKLYLNTKPYRTIEEYINNFNYSETKQKNNNINTSFKNINESNISNNDDNNLFYNIKKCFKKNQNNYINSNKEREFCQNNNKSFISQRTDMKINQVYVPKKHIHRSSAPTTPLYKNIEMKNNNNNNIYNTNENINNNYNNYYTKYDNINRNNYNHSCEKRNPRYLNVSNFNENSISKNIEKLRELSGPKIFPILKKNIIIGNANNISMVQQRTNINHLNKKKLLNNHRNYTNIYPNLSINNNKISSTINSNNSNHNENEKCKNFKNYRAINTNSNLEKKMSKKNQNMNRNINKNLNNDTKNKVLVTTNEKYNLNILNSSLDKISYKNNNLNNNVNNRNNILNKNYMTNAPKNNITKRKYKKENNIVNNDTLLSKSRKIANIQSGKKNNNNNNNCQNIKNRNTKKAGFNENTNSNSKIGTINKSINSNYYNNNLNSSNKKKNNKNNKNSNIKEKENIPKEKEKEEIQKEKLEIVNNNLINTIISNDENTEDELKTFNFDDYKIITQLGQGSFGKIYLVQNSENKLFTMKKLVYSEELDVQAVLKEYKMCYKIKHPNVVKVLGIYSNKLDKTTYVVYVLMEVGLTDWEKEIKKRIEKKLFYKEEELFHIVKQIINVLSFLQKQNISHRDIKPQNILVFKNNIYKVADFGEAKQIENMTINLACNSLRGTELYMSPLLFNGLRTGQVDIRHNVFKSDVYSLGLCILFSASLEMMSLYDIRKYVEMNDVRKYLEKMFNNKYSNKFIDLLYMLLEIHENKRPDFIDLEKILNECGI